MGDDEAGTLRRLTELREEILEPLIEAHNGRIVKLMGDGLLVEFASSVDSVSCAMAWQERVAQHRAEGADAERIMFRIGINVGDVIVDGDDIHGDGVNIAARLEGLAEPGGICLSDDAYRHVRGKMDAEFEDMGKHELKNVAEPIRIYRATTDKSAAAPVTTDTLPLPEKPSIAVLPFTNMSGDAEQEHFSDGISEDIITALSKISKLFVVARNSTFTYKGKAVDVKQVAREQGVHYVLEGSVRRGGDRLRITAQLIDAATGHHVWAERYDRMMRDVFELQDEITREVTSALQVELTEGEQARLWAGGTKNHEAWELMIQVPQLIQSHRKEETFKGRRLAERALQLDENYADAWTWLGWSHYEEAFHGWSETPDQSIERAVDAAARARSIDDSNPDTYALLTFIHLTYRDFDGALKFSQKAVELGPNNSFAAGVAANVALFCNKPRDLAVLMRKAMRLCPIYPAWYMGDLAWAYLLMDRLEDAVSTAEEAVRLDPDYVYTYMVLAVAFVELGREDAARRAAENILRIEPHYSTRLFAETQPFRDAEVLNRHVQGLRKAGVPD